MEPTHIVHPIPPTYDAASEILILGSFPSVKSREMMYFYGHPQNRFWKIMAALYGEDVPMSVEQRRAFLLRRHIAVWDVIASCTITGSSDSSIRDVVPNDLSVILNAAPIRQIFTNGKKAFALYQKHIAPVTHHVSASTTESDGFSAKVGSENCMREVFGQPDAVCLPSSSPANAAWSLERLTEEWRRLLFGEM